MTNILMPRLGLTMEEATLVRWVIAEGAAFVEGDELAEVETDKALSPVHATFSGRLVKILVHEGDVVKVLTPIAEAEEA
jgi:pyruvate dehydrogenase E2 component (dihydrolipoamide acetyltransferase)